MSEENHNFDGRMILECPKCNHRWYEEFKLPMRIDVFLARAKGTDICPNCGNKRKIAMLTGQRFKDAMKELGLVQ